MTTMKFRMREETEKAVIDKFFQSGFGRPVQISSDDSAILVNACQAKKFESSSNVKWIWLGACIRLLEIQTSKSLSDLRKSMTEILESITSREAFREKREMISSFVNGLNGCSTGERLAEEDLKKRTVLDEWQFLESVLLRLGFELQDGLYCLGKREWSKGMQRAPRAIAPANPSKHPPNAETIKLLLKKLRVPFKMDWLTITERPIVLAEIRLQIDRLLKSIEKQELKFDFSVQTIQLGSKKVRLTGTEWKTLIKLWEYSPKVVSKGEFNLGEKTYIKTCVSRVKNSLKKNGLESVADLIVPIRERQSEENPGYRMDLIVPVEPPSSKPSKK
jgi:hypothetical protein